MADATPPQSDLKAHAKGYAKFITVFKWGAIASFIVAAAVVYGIS